MDKTKLTESGRVYFESLQRMLWRGPRGLKVQALRHIQEARRREPGLTEMDFPPLIPGDFGWSLVVGSMTDAEIQAMIDDGCKQ